MDATAQAELVRSGEASPGRAGRRRRSSGSRQLNPELNAVIHELFDEGRAEAARRRCPTGRSRACRSCSRTSARRYAGQPLHMGMQALKDADFRAPVDTYLAERFRAAGLVTIGKTNTPELGHPADDRARRLRRRRATPGTSSARPAARAAAPAPRSPRAWSPLAHANDGGGSIRIPAAQLGLVGLKPTRQRITRGPARRRQHLRPDRRAGRLDARSATPRAILDAVHGPAPGRPVRRAGAAAPLRRGARRRADRPADRRLDEPPVDGLEVDPECVAAVEGRRRSCSSRSATRSRSRRRSTRRRRRRRSTSRTAS